MSAHAVQAAVLLVLLAVSVAASVGQLRANTRVRREGVRPTKRG